MKFIQDRPLLFWGNLLLYVWLMAYALFVGFGLFCRRVPAMPAICLAAGWGLWQAREMWRGRGAVIREGQMVIIWFGIREL